MPSIVSPSRSVTIAFFQFGRRPADLPTRRTLPRWFDVQTPVTFTPNRCSIAWRIAGFDASGATSNTYSPRPRGGDRRLLGHDRTHDGAKYSGHDLPVLLLGRLLGGALLRGRLFRGRRLGLRFRRFL